MDVSSPTRSRTHRNGSDHRARRHLVAGLACAGTMWVMSGCSVVSDDAARVDGKTLANDEFQELLDAYSSAGGSGILPSGNFDAEVVRVVLQDWIGTSILESTLGEYGVEIDEADRAEAERTLEDQQGFADAPPIVKEFFIRATAMRTVAGTTFSPDPEELAALYATGPAESGVACLRLILVESREAADEARNRITVGEPFADVAQSVSTDPSAASGGVLADNPNANACYAFDDLVAQIVEQLGAAVPTLQPEVVSEPIEVPDVGWVLLLLRPFTEVNLDVERIIGPITATRLANSALDNSSVWVNPEYGRWDTESRRIVANVQ